MCSSPTRPLLASCSWWRARSTMIVPLSNLAKRHLNLIMELEVERGALKNRVPEPPPTFTASSMRRRPLARWDALAHTGHTVVLYLSHHPKCTCTQLAMHMPALAPGLEKAASLQRKRKAGMMFVCFGDFQPMHACNAVQPGVGYRKPFFHREGRLPKAWPRCAPH
jgi:hypothetical protein